MKTIAVIHTTSATVESISTLIKNELGDVKIVNVLDDSMLDDMIHKNKVEKVEERWLSYARMQSDLGVDAILSACSTVGEFAEKANELLPVPVYRIDEAMAEKAISKGQKISVFATLNSTLEPTVRLIQRKAELFGKNCSIQTVLVNGAYEELMKGNRELHNQRIQEEVQKQAPYCDVIVLAQASMASALTGLSSIDNSKVLTSPALGIRKLKADLQK